ncbi:PREDICTED: X antigen family member 3-like [Mandrillus leucophaeus]|uniref:X antigen family member 3-like n=1 Tax=Mandrillus leucophaeus TaxID=9568 RepID=UPI0005F4DA6C|nr:PREDICTED: X antigen family member 3-like [Mandrillus leucophaeus]
MSWQGRSTYKPRPRGSLQFPELIGLMLISALTFHQPSDEEPQEEKPPTESQDSTHGQEREEDQDAAEIQMPDLEADLKDLSQSKTGDEWGDGTDVQGKILQKSYQFKMPETVKGNVVTSFFHADYDLASRSADQSSQKLKCE